jgi:L-lactate dehydrogenase complex protein LldG
VASSRDVVLAALRRGAIEVGEAPQLERLGVRYPDPLARFEQGLAAAGGECRRIAPGVAVADSIRTLPCFTAARRILSGVAEIASLHPDTDPNEPRDLADLDLAILPGSPAVAENGAVWVSPRDELERAACFLADHVILLVPRDALVHDLHDAFERIPLGARGFGCFVAGPSKTADIEQSLVIGAHGPRSLTVLLRG